MQRKAYVPGAAVLLATLLAGCTGGSDDGGTPPDSKAGDSTATRAAAQPGRYRTLPEPCGAIGHETLDALLPGIAEITDAQRREKAYAGEATLTFDTDRKVGCRWKVESADATDHLLVDFERVVSYDSTVSDDSRAAKVYGALEEAADLPEPSSPDASGSGSTSEDATTEDAAPEKSASGDAASKGASSDAPSSGNSGDEDTAAGSADDTPSGSATATGTPAALPPRTLDGLGDEAFLDDELSAAGSTVRQRTVTVVFRTSNVVVTIRYEEQPAGVGVVPDSEEMQDRARKLAERLAESLNS
ncbi:DUF3558 domain-containing protein [Streptomyces sp. NPDC005551]|uniref:DUF3558 domain-containing protein n=1 Tax=unclassified Streptomyces TaxID=2593676 RepID=UPI00340AC034